MSLPPEHSDLPDALTRDLHGLYARDVRVPGSIAASVLADARAGFARRRRFRLALRGAAVASGVAAAALVVIAIRLGMPGATPAPSELAKGPPQAATTLPSQPVARAEDVDHSGRVDILDAFVVARLIEVQGQLDRPAYDVNGDGKVDRADVDRIAVAAVDTAPAAGTDGRAQ
jgi:hypothetical protein